MPKIKVTNPRNVIDVHLKTNYFKLRNTGGPKGDRGDTGATGPQGPKGDTGNAATIYVGSTTTLQPGESATVENAGDKYHAVLNFGIPEGQKGDTGDAATIEVGTTTTSAPGSDASVANSGDEHNAVLDFVIPRGSQGLQGVPGQAATIEVGTVTTIDPDQDATVVNSGTTSAAVFDFGIPKGDKGDTGSVSSEVVTELPVPGDDSKLYLMEKNSTVETADGAEFTIQNTATDGEMKLVELKGNATQDGTPTPDAPVAVNTTTGENAVKITGKNLAWSGWAQDFVARVNDSTKATIGTYYGKNCLMFDANAGYGDYDNKYMFKTDFAPNTQYTFSFKEFTENTNSYANLQITYTDGTYTEAPLITYNEWSDVVITSTAGKTIAYLQARWRGSLSYIDLGTLQIEEGTQASSYEPYQEQEHTIDLGSIELAKIGNYQDRIYKTDGKWYVEKQTGKVVLDGSETWTIYQTNAYFTRISDCFIAPDSSTSFYGVSNYYTGATQTQLYNATTDCISFRLNQAGVIIKNMTANTTAEFNTWLSTHPTTVYYALATPTTTEITDSTLLAQLNFIANLYGGTNNIMLVGTGAQGEIAVEYQTWDKYNRYDVYIWNDQIGDYQILNS